MLWCLAGVACWDRPHRDAATLRLIAATLDCALDRALRKAALEREVRALREQAATDDLGLAGRSEAIERLRTMVRRLGPSTVSVLVLGPTGTGKELVARALHTCSARTAGPFVSVHCGALPATSLESELFGHLKGSFTGAHRDQPGLVETAHRGTLLLDEVGEMPAAMQVKLLRFLQEGTFLPVGGRAAKRADVRVVAATHRDLEAMAADGSFREDLFYRLKGMVLRTPSLAERPGDVPLLAGLFLRRAMHDGVFAPDAIGWLTAHLWPGNVRELRAMVEAAAALAHPGREPVDAELLRFVSGETDEMAPSSRDAGGSLSQTSEDAPRSRRRQFPPPRDGAAMSACQGRLWPSRARSGLPACSAGRPRSRVAVHPTARCPDFPGLAW